MWQFVQSLEKFSHQNISGCVVKDCNGVDIEGTFVQYPNSDDKTNYIIPLCSVHAKSTEVLEVLASCKFVSSDFESMCGTARVVVEPRGIL